MSKEYQIICIDDDEQFLCSLEASLPDKVAMLCDRFTCRFEFVPDAQELQRLITQQGHFPAMLIADQVMPGTTGIELIDGLKSKDPSIVCVLLTGHAGLDSAKYAINRHLLDQYVSKPIEDLQRFALLVANLLKQRHCDLEERERTAQLAQMVESLRISNDKIRAMHAASEQIAMLSKSFKALDFDEVSKLITHEVPKIFGAQWSTLCFTADGCVQASTHHKDCPCSAQEVLANQHARGAIERADVCSGDVGDVCARHGAKSP